jgi:hypothetical protein
MRKVAIYQVLSHTSDKQNPFVLFVIYCESHTHTSTLPTHTHMNPPQPLSSDQPKITLHANGCFCILRAGFHVDESSEVEKQCRVEKSVVCVIHRKKVLIAFAEPPE